jgi:hypothetical protein
MNHTIMTFAEALKNDKLPRRHLLLGNGFSIACRSDIFRYESLFEQADFSALNNTVEKVFEVLNTKDFEIVMKQLRGASQLISVYDPTNTRVIAAMLADAEDLKNVLVNAIASSHPENPSEINESEFQHSKRFLTNFQNIYSLNYDLLLYWTTMHFQETKEIHADDGFRTPDSGKAQYVSWDIEKTNGQNVFYLHGALHIFDTPAELQKYTWVNTGIKLIEQIRNALDANSFPLFVSEGSSLEKMNKIMHSNYLSRCFRSFSNITGSLFIYGHSLANNDSHILNLIPKSKIENLYVSLYGDQTTKENIEIIQKAEQLQRLRQGKKSLSIYFFDAESAQVWN